MENSKQREVDLVRQQELEEILASEGDEPMQIYPDGSVRRIGDPAPLPIAGRIIITFYDADGHVIPEVSFAPLGRINPNTIERYLPHIYQEIQKQQVKERHNYD